MIGVPDEIYGEVVGAFVVRAEDCYDKLDAEDARHWSRKRLSHLGNAERLLRQYGVEKSAEVQQ